jgi:hypothetical protein
MSVIVITLCSFFLRLWSYLQDTPNRLAARCYFGAPLRAAIKVINRGTSAIRRIVLWDGPHRSILMNSGGRAAWPVLQDGETYHLVVERADRCGPVPRPKQLR